MTMRTLVREILTRYRRRFSRSKYLLNFQPLSVLCQDFGASRGKPIDRVLIERFLSDHALISGHSTRVLEFGSSDYTNIFYPKSNSFVLQYKPNTRISLDSHGCLTGDLLLSPEISECVDVVIATQVLAFTKNPYKALHNLTTLLTPGGILLGTEPFLSPISKYDEQRWGDFFRFTIQGLRSVIEETQNLELDLIINIGNRKTSLAILHGLCAEDLKVTSYALEDNFPTLVGYVAKKLK